MSSNITLRLEKGTDLSFEEGDENFTHIRRLYRFTEDSVTTGGAGNAYTITSVNTPQGTFEANMMFGFTASFSNSSTDPTLAIDSLDPKIIVGVNGDTIQAGQISTGNFYIVRYNVSNDRYYVVGSAVDRLAMQQAIDDLQSQIDDNVDELGDIRTTQGVAAGATNLGTFPGSIIPNNQSVKGALTSLESAVASNDSDIAANAAAIAAIASLGITANATDTGSITIPYNASNAILINWGSAFVSGDNSTTVSFNKAFTTFFQAVPGFESSSTGIGDGCSYTATNTQITLVNSHNAAHVITYIAVGRLAI